MKRIFLVLFLLASSRSFARGQSQEVCFTDANICGVAVYEEKYNKLVLFQVNKADFPGWTSDALKEFKALGIHVNILSGAYDLVKNSTTAPTIYVPLESAVDQLDAELNQLWFDQWVEGGVCVLSTAGCVASVWGSGGLALLVARYGTCGLAALACVKAFNTHGRWKQASKKMDEYVKERNRQITAPQSPGAGQEPGPRPPVGAGGAEPPLRGVVCHPGHTIISGSKVWVEQATCELL